MTKRKNVPTFDYKYNAGKGHGIVRGWYNRNIEEYEVFYKGKYLCTLHTKLDAKINDVKTRLYELMKGYRNIPFSKFEVIYKKTIYDERKN